MGSVETFDVGNAGRVLVLQLPPEGVPLPGAAVLTELDKGLAEGGKGVVVDTSPREVVTSAAIGFVIMVRQHLQPDVRVALHGGRQLDRLVEMMNLSGVLPTFETMDEARAHALGS